MAIHASNNDPPPVPNYTDRAPDDKVTQRCIERTFNESTEFVTASAIPAYIAALLPV
jgi:hypothetical protein